MNASLATPLRARLARVVLLALPIFLAFTVPAGIVSGLLAWWNGDDWFTAGNQSTGIVCGLIAWLFLACLHVRREVSRISFTDKTRFLAQLREQLAELGYEISEQEADHLISRPHFSSYLFGGRLTVVLENNVATISGPRLFVEMLRYRLRIFGAVAKAQDEIIEGRQKQTAERLLRRVSITLRPRIADLAVIHQQLTQILEREGAEARCQIQLLLQKDSGLPEQVVDLELRDWLRAQGIAFDLQKDLVQWQERRRPGSNPSLSSSCFTLPALEPAAAAPPETPREDARQLASP